VGESTAAGFGIAAAGGWVIGGGVAVVHPAESKKPAIALLIQ